MVVVKLGARDELDQVAPPLGIKQQTRFSSSEYGHRRRPLEDGRKGSHDRQHHGQDDYPNNDLDELFAPSEHRYLIQVQLTRRKSGRGSS
jgi:hypothetical protein